MTLQEFLDNQALRERYLSASAPNGIIGLQRRLLQGLHPVRNCSGPYSAERQAFIAGFEHALQLIAELPHLKRAEDDDDAKRRRFRPMSEDELATHMQDHFESAGFAPRSTQKY